MSARIEVVEVGPRDGLQNEPRPIPTAAKIALIDLLARAGFRRIEVASFVRPDLVPQMADGAEVLAGITRVPGLRCIALAPNLRGFARALAAGADEVALFGSASEGFSHANTNCSVSAAVDAARAIAEAARDANVKLRGYVSCAVECPYDGAVPPGRAAEVAAALDAMGCYEVSLADTIGRARPEAVGRMLEAVTTAVPPARLAGHFHDTAGLALQNVEVALAAGLRVFDAAVGGLGGCPFAPGAAGNLATEKLVAWLAARGWETGVDMALVGQAAAMAHALRA